jgi:esterase/lipase superfamily enzyme
MNDNKFVNAFKSPSIIGVISLFLFGCSSKPELMPTPNIYANNQYSLEQVPLELRQPKMELLYVTDRKSSEEDESYSSERSPSMAFGLMEVGFNNETVTWQQLMELSNQQKRRESLIYKMQKVKELGRFPASPYPFERTETGMKINSEIGKKHDAATENLQNVIRKKLSHSNQKDVVLFIHGFNNTFNEAGFTLAGLWHFMNRKAVPLVYSWPAAEGGLMGYFVDRESGEYTIFHLKETLRVLFEMPEIENIHIIAHSRGTDVATTALRELVIENRGAGGNPYKDFRIENLILAAPDLDFGIIKQRLMSEQFGLAFGQINIYTSDDDSALGISEWLMNGLRFGRVDSSDIAMNEKNIFKSVGNVSLIKVAETGGLIGHDYFHSNPAVSSDIIKVIQKYAKPGSKERPLTLLENNFWKLPTDYLKSDNSPR